MSSKSAAGKGLPVRLTRTQALGVEFRDLGHIAAGATPLELAQAPEMSKSGVSMETRSCPFHGVGRGEEEERIENSGVLELFVSHPPIVEWRV
jgi:hypothetical protein